MMMRRNDIEQATDIIVRVVDQLLATTDVRTGRASSDLRRACGDVRAHAEKWITAGTIAEPLAECFELARNSGATLVEFDSIRRNLLAETPLGLIAVLTVQCCVLFCLQQESMVISVTDYRSRQDVERDQAMMNDAFNAAEEVAADQMESSTYQALIALHAAVTFHLYDTARPLPRVVAFRFAAPSPTLVFAYRLYDDAARGDELRDENKVVHPAFMHPTGVALSA